MTRPSVRMEVQGGSDHWVVRDRGGAYVGSALPYYQGWLSAVQRALRVAAAQPEDLSLPIARPFQRAITDVGLRVSAAHPVDGWRSTLEWFPPGKALWMLNRYGNKAKFQAGESRLYCYVVEGVDPRTET